MDALRKLALNLGPNALRVLGLAQYLRLALTMLRSFPEILRTRDLRPVDRRMGSRVVSIRFLGRRFLIDCPATDSILRDGTFTFGIIRELFIRNCYIRGNLADRLNAARYVLDLGANRGIFSVMAAITADHVVAVETLAPLVDAIRANASANHLNNVAIESSFIGSGGRDASHAASTVTIQELLQKYEIPRFDLVKIDIEGSEFGLFENPTWLAHVRGICMEVHPAYGDVSAILRCLTEHRFEFQIADHQFQSVSDPQQAELLWGWTTD